MGMYLTLVVGGATREHPAVVDDRLERRRRPQVQRIHRLDVVMAVDERGGRPFGMQPVGVDDGVERRLLDRDVLEAGPPEGVCEPLGGTADVGSVLRQRRDAGDPQEVLVALQPSVVRLVQVRVEGGVGRLSRRHARPREVRKGPRVYVDVCRGAGAAAPGRRARWTLVGSTARRHGTAPGCCPGRFVAFVVERRIRPAAGSAPGWAALGR